MLTDDQVRRYSRHILVPDVGGVGQEKLLAAEVRIDVRDPAGREAATYLAAAGVRVSDAPDAIALTIDPLDLAPIAGSARADALVRGGVAACRLIHELVKR